MKFISVIILFMTTINLSAQDGKATTLKNTFNRETSISIEIKTDAETIWNLLTDSESFSNWNSTITSLEGVIAKGEKLKLKSSLDETRTFKLKVKEFEPYKKMIWGDGKGNRIYTLTPNNNNTVTFSMVEKIGGLMFPMYAKYIPSFDETFEKFASDTKKEAERIYKSIQ